MAYRITESEVVKNKRLMLNAVSRILYRPQSPYQVIVGKNGSGKSTLLKMLTSYNPEAGDFHKQGFMRTKIHANESDYEIVAEAAGKGVRYSFKKNGRELNEGGTRTVQRDLYALEFNYTQDVHEILTGEIRLTRLGPAKRQELFSRIGGTDVTFAYKVYNRLKGKLRDAVGYKRGLEESLVQRQTRDISEEEHEVLKQRLKGYQDTVTELLQEYRPDIEDKHADALEAIVARLETIGDKALEHGKKLIPDAPLDASNRDMYTDRLGGLQLEYQEYATKEKAYQEQYDSLNTTLEQLVGDGSVDNLEEEVRRLEQQLVSFRNVTWFQPGMEYPNPEAAWDSISAILPSLQDALFNLPVNADNQYNANALHETNQSLSRGRSLLSKVENEIAQAEARLHHLNEEHDAKCPKCGYSSNEEKRASEARVLTEKLGTMRTQRETYGKRLVELEEQQGKITEWIRAYERVMSFEQSNPSLKLYFSTLFHAADIMKSPMLLVSIAGNLAVDLEHHAQYAKLSREHADKEKLLLTLQEKDIKGTGQLRARMEQLSKQIEDVVYARVYLHELIKRDQARLEQADTYSRYVDSLTGQVEALGGDVQVALEAMFNRIRKIAIEDLQGWIGTLTKELNDIHTNREAIKDAMEQIRLEEEKIAGYKFAIEGLSPANGLIAKHMTGAINNFINEMNSIIRQIWTTPLEVMPCGFDDNAELTYVFPVVVNEDDSHPAKDVNQCSDGQVEIIDFAFKVVALLQLGQEGAPLLLDETDRPLEVAHKTRLMNYVKELIENNVFSQVFLISHHEAAWGALPFHDVLEVGLHKSHPDYNKVAQLA
ncbi:SbcC [Erwinia phage PhiEaH1]|uniref:SbcC n=1 Tax=Erwinia phage PhiEaH1 TaxID=1401669 RepID=W8D093_9CAUD|nr:SbcC [Erwinia phage PhiEaH1]AGX01909.1 SbcC [Erwinia phage PhiEaH1]